MKEAIVGAALVLVAASCAPQTHTSSSTTATTTSHAQAVRAWTELTNDHMQDLGIAVGKAIEDADSHDYADLAAACHQAHDAVDALQGREIDKEHLRDRQRNHGRRCKPRAL